MGALTFLMVSRIKNGFKNLLSPKTLLPVVFFILIFLPSIMSSSAEGLVLSNNVLSMKYFGLVTFITYSFIYNLIRDGVILEYKDADNKFVLLTPMSPFKKYIYGAVQKFIKSLSLYLVVFVVAGIILVKNLGLSLDIALLMLVGIILAFIVTLFVVTLLKVAYNDRPYLRNVFSVIFIILFLLSAGVIALNFLMPEPINPMVINAFPIAGWFNGIIFGIIEGNVLQVVLFLSITLAVVLAIAVVLYRADFNKIIDADNKVKIEKSIKSKGIKSANSKTIKGSGTLSIFYKNIISQWRKDKLFFITSQSVVLLVISVFMTFMFNQVFLAEVGVPSDIFMVFVTCFVLLMTVQLCKTSSTKEEVNHYYLRLFPIKPIKKVFTLTWVVLFTNAPLCILALIINAIIVSADAVTAIGCILAFLSYMLVFITLNLMIELKFDIDTPQKEALWVYAKMFFSPLLMIPGFIFGSVAYFFLQSLIPAYCIVIVVNIILYMLFCKLCTKIVD